MPLIFWILAGVGVAAVGVGVAAGSFKAMDEAAQGVHEAADALGKAAGFALILGAGGALFYYIKK